MANVAITVRRKIIKSIEISVEDSSENNTENDAEPRRRPELDDRTPSVKPKAASKETIVGPTGVPRPFIAETSRNSDKQSKSIQS